MRVSGQVQAVIARDTRAGTFYDVQVNGKKYGHGKYPPRGVSEGDFVSFDVDVKQNGQYTNYDIRRGSLKIDDEGAAEESAKPEAGAPRKTWADRAQASAPSKGGYVAFDERQEIISKQAALNTALQLCNLAVTTGSFTMPASAKAGDKLGMLTQWVYDTAGQIYKQTTGRDNPFPEGAEPVALPAKPKATKRVAEPEAAPEDTGLDEYPDE